MKPFTLALTVAVFLPAGLSTAAEAELPTVEVAARRFRIAIYETYRTDRSQYDTRRNRGDELENAWVVAGEPADHAETVATWFLEAAALTEFNPDAELPPTPEFPVSASKGSTSSAPSRVAETGLDVVAEPAASPRYRDADAIRMMNELGSQVEQGSPTETNAESNEGEEDGSMSSFLLKGFKRVVFGE